MSEELGYESIWHTLEERFHQTMTLHLRCTWAEILQRLTEEKRRAVEWMEQTGGEPNVVELNRRLVFVDMAKETPTGRRSLCYDEEARQSRKSNKPISSAAGEAERHHLHLLTEAEYFELQERVPFDLKTSSWVRTPEELRSRGGALFCDRRYDRVFVYHNGAESYYASRGFRGYIEL
ncbi:MAG: DUF4256 domain-containing protein [Ndongobacter sp.]|nr:DUF4256 domain-containing protein [Ndongobacter sp.]